jgi:hypothetical protein
MGLVAAAIHHAHPEVSSEQISPRWLALPPKAAKTPLATAGA